MISSQLCSSLIFLTLWASVPASILPNDKPTTPADISTTESYEDTPCGTVFDAPSGYISYKDGVSFDTFERCSWTVHVPWALTYKFSVVRINVPDSFDGLTISGFRRDAFPEVDNYWVTRPGDFYVPAEVAVLTFYSDHLMGGQGFLLHYEALVVANVTHYLPTSRDVIVTDPSRTTIHHPESGVFGEFELSSFVYSPGFSESKRIEANYTLKSIGDCNLCIFCNTVTVYKFLSYGLTGKRFILDTTLCGGDRDRSASFDSTDIILFLFKTSNGLGSKGFQIDFQQVDV